MVSLSPRIDHQRSFVIDWVERPACFVAGPRATLSVSLVSLGLCTLGDYGVVQFGHFVCTRIRMPCVVFSTPRDFK